MKERERALVTGLVVLMLVLWLGFVFHRSPRFAGSFWGGLLAVVGALLMLVPLVYLFVKRIKPLKRGVKKWTSMRTLLAWHIYAGVLGPILVLLHTGHKFESALGIALTTTTLIVVVSGFVGRYLMNRISQEIREKKAMLTQLTATYDQLRSRLASDPDQAAAVRSFAGFFSRIVAGFFVELAEPQPAGGVSPGTAVRLVDSIADLEYAVSTHAQFKRWFSKWLKWHIAISMFLYVLMALHIWAAIHFGLRWFEPTTTDYFNGRQHNAAQNAPRRSPIPTAEAVDTFSAHFAKLFRTTWRSPTKIHGIPTTVFDYAEWARQAKQPKSDFSQAKAALKQVDATQLGGGNREKAFWINVYNFAAMKLAAENYPIDSITNLKISSTANPWGLKSIRVGNRQYGLKQIENEILLERFGDPRIVFAVSCAAVSCPDRTAEIFNEDRLDSQLDAMIRTLLTNPAKGLRRNRESRTLTISWIIRADQRLFKTKTGDGILDFISRYTSAEMADWIRVHREEITIQYFKHDWGLNDLALADKESR